MPRVLVVADSPEREIVMDEWVDSAHVSSDHSAAQLTERLLWGVKDAEQAERDGTRPATRRGAGPPTSRI